MDVVFLVVLLVVGTVAHPENGGQQGPGPVGGGSGPMGGGSGPMRGGSGPMGGGSGPMGGGSGPMRGRSGPMRGGSGPMGGGSGPMGGGSGPMGGGSGPMGGGSGPMRGGSGPMGGGSGPMGRHPGPRGGAFGPMERGPGPMGGGNPGFTGGVGTMGGEAGPMQSPSAMKQRPGTKGGHRTPKNDSSESLGKHHKAKNETTKRFGGRGDRPPVVPGQMRASDGDQSWSPSGDGPRNDFGIGMPVEFAELRGGSHRGSHGGSHRGPPHHGEKPFSPNFQFIPLFKTDNITLQDLNFTLPLREGENMFVLSRSQIQGLLQTNRNDFRALMPYVKMIFTPTAAKKLSLEFGVMQKTWAENPAG
ncbi:keratin, type I cytoskeletal 9-like isoform X1 [Silurus meridionalis]|uniref:keratin, type I cytoskeletal 9-like isoform X1 n=1 Tax=Silurus meridionalis TaxID=175797 RepID=UPI001EEBFA7F|nr:keratin, type I cytoskeletal 9-like isoform X1 [Silurus meridionalis]XP_046699370.1 keratin, type I cytoskeletal 9-like isoform X1 [Silurus meridionalis]XP_046699371.1 keratin, type I cytoskeletal 9-like isoform X1 [Silurus meridionalis]XP_046699372.1 keratin, type I cytoskeletal 9-like isoform X1 [Silurus meridionalis]XP_046699373.1 keratin, type I cytoskeletal 9-like isoform X1 [Silurus meridionalis]XP_046699374.1 keratin, type I cytoskeletal 9-like isoform X1 [Silurus meridionalis]XP_04